MVNLLWFNIFLLMSAIMAHAKDMDLYCGGNIIIVSVLLTSHHNFKLAISIV